MATHEQTINKSYDHVV